MKLQGLDQHEKKACYTLESSTQLLFGVRLVNYSFDPQHTKIYVSTLKDLKITTQGPCGTLRVTPTVPPPGREGDQHAEVWQPWV